MSVLHSLLSQSHHQRYFRPKFINFLLHFCGYLMHSGYVPVSEKSGYNKRGQGEIPLSDTVFSWKLWPLPRRIFHIYQLPGPGKPRGARPACFDTSFWQLSTDLSKAWSPWRVAGLWSSRWSRVRKDFLGYWIFEPFRWIFLVLRLRLRRSRRWTGTPRYFGTVRGQGRG